MAGTKDFMDANVKKLLPEFSLEGLKQRTLWMQMLSDLRKGAGCLRCRYWAAPGRLWKIYQAGSRRGEGLHLAGYQVKGGGAGRM